MDTIERPLSNSADSLPLLERLGYEVREELHQVIGSLEGAGDEFLADSQANHLLQARTTIDRLLRTVNDLILLAAPERFANSASPLCVADFISAFATWFAARARLKGLEFTCALESDAPRWIVADRELMETVLGRVLESCVQSTSHGSVALSVAWSKGRLILNVVNAGKVRAHLSHGPEIPVHEALTEELWLRVVRKRLDAAGGQFTMSSAVANEVNLRIAIPATAAHPAGASPQVQASPHTMRILVAEDHDDSFATFEMLVRGEGHHLFRAQNGKEAFEMARQDDFDLIVMDVRMPGVDGYEATRLIREWETERAKPRSPIVLLSAEDPARLSRVGPSVGCSGFLTKPIRKQELIRALRYYGRYRCNDTVLSQA